MSVWSVEAITEFIRLFREHPCLWKIKSKDYSNRNMRNKAYDELVDFCKTLGFASANREFVTKKIQNLRGAFRKELKKVTETQNKSGSSQDDVYKPSLWYYDHLLFTKDQELPTPSISNMMAEDDSIEAEIEAETIMNPANCTPPSQQCTNDTPTSQQPTNITSSPNPNYIGVEEPARGSKRKAKKPNVIDTQIKFMNVCTEALKKIELSEYEAFSITIAKKLEKMNSIQALYAETIIHSVLRRGLLNQLSDLTDICDKQCNKTIILSASNTMPRPSSSTSSVDTEATYNLPLQPTQNNDESQCMIRDYYNNYTDLE